MLHAGLLLRAWVSESLLLGSSLKMMIIFPVSPDKGAASSLPEPTSLPSSFIRWRGEARKWCGMMVGRVPVVETRRRWEDV